MACHASWQAAQNCETEQDVQEPPKEESPPGPPGPPTPPPSPPSPPSPDFRESVSSVLFTSHPTKCAPWPGRCSTATAPATASWPGLLRPLLSEQPQHTELRACRGFFGRLSDAFIDHLELRWHEPRKELIKVRCCLSPCCNLHALALEALSDLWGTGAAPVHASLAASGLAEQGCGCAASGEGAAEPGVVREPG